MVVKECLKAGGWRNKKRTAELKGGRADDGSGDEDDDDSRNLL